MNEPAVDNQLHDARRLMSELFGDDGKINAEQAMTLIRLAYGKGYTDSLKAEDRKRMAVLLGFVDTETGEIHE